MAEQNSSAAEAAESKHSAFLMKTCFVALVATSFAFIIRVMLMRQWQVDFGLTETQKGEIFGAGMWPFGVSIVLFSLVIDRIGYGKAMIFAFVCHFASAILLVCAKDYWWLYAGSILNGLAAGTVEAVINPAIASTYPKQKTKMLSILHAGWPGGFVLGGLVMILLGHLGVTWRVNVVIILVPTLCYGIMLLKAKFPVSERVAAGIPYRDMLREAGALSCLIVVYLICSELNARLGWPLLLDTTFFDLPSLPMTLIIVGLTVAYFLYTKSLGRPVYIILLFVMVLLAITELGIDSWVVDLMGPAMEGIGIAAGFIIVYTALIMMLLRFCAGPIERALKPLGVLFCGSVLAAIGLHFLSSAVGIGILITATIYALGKTFFWPVTLGLVSERFPKGGALTLNVVSGVGMLGVGILGSQLLGYWQDTSIDRDLAKLDQKAYVRLMGSEEKRSIFGTYKALDRKKVNGINDTVALFKFRQGKAEDLESALLPEELSAKLANDGEYQALVRTAYDHLIRAKDDTAKKSHAEMHKALVEKGALVSVRDYKAVAADKALLDQVSAAAKRNAMATVATLPCIMAACYLGLILYFKAKGGYQAIDLMAEAEGAAEAPGAEAPPAEGGEEGEAPLEEEKGEQA